MDTWLAQLSAKGLQFERDPAAYRLLDRMSRRQAAMDRVTRATLAMTRPSGRVPRREYVSGKRKVTSSASRKAKRLQAVSHRVLPATALPAVAQAQLHALARVSHIAAVPNTDFATYETRVVGPEVPHRLFSRLADVTIKRHATEEKMGRASRDTHDLLQRLTEPYTNSSSTAFSIARPNVRRVKEGCEQRVAEVGPAMQGWSRSPSFACKAVSKAAPIHFF